MIHKYELIFETKKSSMTELTLLEYTNEIERLTKARIIPYAMREGDRITNDGNYIIIETNNRLIEYSID